MQIVDYTRVSKKEANSKMFVPSISHSQFVKHPLGTFCFYIYLHAGVEGLYCLIFVVLRTISKSHTIFVFCESKLSLF